VEEFYEIADLDRVWVYADVYEDEAGHLWPGMAVKVKHEQSGRTFDAKISQVLPLFDSVAKTLKVRLDIDNPRYDLRPDMFVDVEIPITMEPSLHVSADAVIDSGTKKIVYVDAGENTFEPRRVETGWRLGRRIEITDGLMPGDKIIVSGNFLIDSESRMKTAAGGEIPAMSMDPVCGMYVNQDFARLTDKTATYGEKTYYFCMDECRDSFAEEPEKYVEQKAPVGEHEHHAAMKTDDKNWLEMLAPGKGSHLIEKSGTFPGQKMKRTIGKPFGSGEVIDWDGPDQEESSPRDWSGWGKFPGATYLGIPKEKKMESEHDKDMPGMDNTMDAEEDAPHHGTGSGTEPGAHHPNMKMESEHDKDMPGMDNTMDAEEDAPHHGTGSGTEPGAHHLNMKNEMKKLPASAEPSNLPAND
jgi:YHS domain-containing protein